MPLGAAALHRIRAPQIGSKNGAQTETAAGIAAGPIIDCGVAALPVCVGLVHGFFNGAAFKEGAGALGLPGIILVVPVALAPAFVVSLETPWKRIAVPMAGSWIA